MYFIYTCYHRSAVRITQCQCELHFVHFSTVFSYYIQLCEVCRNNQTNSRTTEHSQFDRITTHNTCFETPIHKGTKWFKWSL